MYIWHWAAVCFLLRIRLIVEASKPQEADDRPELISLGTIYASHIIITMDWTKNWSTIAKGFNTGVQATRERLGQVEADEITELPQEYKDLEARVDQLRNAHIGLHKVTNVYSTEAYDYPVHIQESLADFGSTLGASFSSLAAQFPAAKSPTSPASEHPPPPKNQPHKTLPHALSRASAASASILPPPSRLADALNQFAGGWAAVADARVEHDQVVRQRFLQPWQTTLNTTLAVAMKARQAVKASRLELDAAKQACVIPSQRPISTYPYRLVLV